MVAPSAVYEETVVAGLSAGRSDAWFIRNVFTSAHLGLVAISDSEIPTGISTLPLDCGEKQAICLAVREAAGLVLLDDARARKEARRLGLNVKGTLGVLIDAMRRGVLVESEVVSFIRQIQSRSDIWIAGPLCEEVLKRLGIP